jgi:hypothetical protein
MHLANKKKILNTTTTMLIALTFIIISGILIYTHENMPLTEKNPIYFALGIAFASGGASIFFGMLSNHALPDEIAERVTEARKLF